MTKIKKLLLLTTNIFAIIIINAQIFDWKNPNKPIDSTKKQEIIANEIYHDFYTKDTLDYIKKQKGIIYEDDVKVKNNRKMVLGELDSKGSIIRGITFGNNQGSSVQSSMDMQISGKLSPDVSILASISDHNLPIQADGYTQTLQEFDKIYIQLNIKNHSIIKAGHLDLDSDANYFARYQKRSMGLQFLTEWEKNKNKTSVNVSGGVSRSEFNRIRFQGVEGNQGPYRLTGKNGELYITVISGSEQVYIDGILMKRGENQDYVINYNTGEITFTSFRPIYAQNFINVSYNYTNRNYTRFILTGNIQHQREKLKANFSWFSENDNKNAPLSLNLSDEDKLLLAEAGNNPDLMYANSGVATDYDVNKILYKKIYHTQDDYHYEFSNDANETLYQVSFTYFGDGKGDYKLLQTTNNGRTFEYVGTGLGDYRAVRKLPAPEKTQVYSGSVVYDLENGQVGTDISLSNYDQNLFSSRDSGQNVGYAARFFANKSFQYKSWVGTPMLEYQVIQKNFHILDRINEVDFWRDFNLTSEFNQRTQNRFIFAFNNDFNKTSFLNYKLNYLEEKESYKGIKNDLDFLWKKGRIITQGKLSYLDTKATDINSTFIRGNISSDLNLKKGSWGIGASMEHNKKNYNATNTLDATSYSWREFFIQKKIEDSTRTKLLTKIYVRSNDSVRNNVLSKMNNIIGFMAESSIIKTEKTQLSALIHYRKFFYEDKTVADANNQDFVVGNILYNQQFLNNGLRLQSFYELGNGQEAQREFQYLKVTDGQGVYKWTDYNGDGIQQLDEFEIAEYADLAQYIRVYTNNVNYLPSNKNKLQLALFVNPSVIFTSKNEFLKRWNLNLSLTSQNSYLKDNKALAWNPFEKNKNQIQKNQSILASVLFTSNYKSGWTGNYRFTSNDNLVNANYSNEENKQQSNFLSFGYVFSKVFRTDWENSLQNINNHSQLFDSRNYKLQNWETKPKATYKLSEVLQTELSGALREKRRTDGDEILKAYELSGTLQWEKVKTSIRANFSFINNDFKGNSFSIVGNQMLEGLKVGKNQVWSLLIQQSINSFIQLNVNYEGRNSGDRTIHIGSMQIRASF